MIFERTPLKTPRPYQSNWLKSIPEDWKNLNNAVFRKNLNIEIGCGKGHWIINQAKTHPNNHFIAIEQTQNKSQTLFALTETSDLKNLFAIRAEAIQFIFHCIQDETVSNFYIHFPNPNPKYRQSNKRFIVSASFHVLNQKLQSGGQIHLSSNIRDYIEEAKDFLDQIWKFKTSDILLNQFQNNPRTAFEQKYIKQGQTIYDLVARKK